MKTIYVGIHFDGCWGVPVRGEIEQLCGYGALFWTNNGRIREIGDECFSSKSHRRALGLSPLLPEYEPTDTGWSWEISRVSERDRDENCWPAMMVTTLTMFHTACALSRGEFTKRRPNTHTDSLAPFEDGQLEISSRLSLFLF